jgi:hypothetical protein
MKLSSMSAIALALGVAASAPAMAATATLVYSVTPSPLDANDSSIKYSGNVAETGKAFADYWEFLIPAGGLDISITAQDTVTKSAQLLSKNTSLSLYLCKSNCSDGTLTGNNLQGAVPIPGTLLATDLKPTVIGASQYWNLGSLTSLLPVIGGDTYFVELSGTAGTGKNLTLGITGDIATTAVPEPTTWAMLLVGFAGLSAASYKRARKNRLAPIFG